MRKRLLGVVAIAAGLIYSILTDPVGFFENLMSETLKEGTPNEIFEATHETTTEPSTPSSNKTDG